MPNSSMDSFRASSDTPALLSTDFTADYFSSVSRMACVPINDAWFFRQDSNCVRGASKAVEGGVFPRASASISRIRRSPASLESSAACSAVCSWRIREALASRLLPVAGTGASAYFKTASRSLSAERSVRTDVSFCAILTDSFYPPPEWIFVGLHGSIRR